MKNAQRYADMCLSLFFGHAHHGQHFSIKNYRVVTFKTAVEFMFFGKPIVYIIIKIPIWLVTKSTLGGANQFSNHFTYKINEMKFTQFQMEISRVESDVPSTF